MTCDRCFELLSARLDRELTKKEAEEVELHCVGCGGCRIVKAQLDELREAFADLEDVPAPEGFAQGVMNRIRAEEKKVIPLFQRPQFRALAGLAACTVLAVGLYSTSHSRHGLDAAGEMQARSFNQDIFEDEIAEDSEILSDQNAPMPAAAPGQGEPEMSVGSPPQLCGARKSPQDSAGLYDGEIAVDLEHYTFQNDQYLWMSYGHTPEPGARIIGSTQSLEDFLAQFSSGDFSEIRKQYDETYFASGRLLAVVVEESSGSIRHQISPQGLRRDEVEITRVVPDARTWDLAAWLILAEVDSTFNDGDELAVTVIP